MRKEHLGIVEGYFGTPWTWTARKKVVSALSEKGYGFFIYAPKADQHLRKKWDKPYPAKKQRELQGFVGHCKKHGVQPGIGLSPYEAYMDFNEDKKKALKARIDMFNKMGIERLAILFDDMKGDLPDLAARQAEIMDFVRQHSTAENIMMCPSYYSDDPILDKVFGARSDNYLEDLGKLLDPAIDIFWTGEKVCSASYSPTHLKVTAKKLGRKPFIWDNYPVNDGPKMSNFLHIKAFNNSAAALEKYANGHAVNPALQPILTLIPALTLSDFYEADTDTQKAFKRAVSDIVDNNALSKLIIRDKDIFQDGGLSSLTKAEKAKLRAEYAAFNNPAAREILKWLDGKYQQGPEVLTQ